MVLVMAGDDRQSSADGAVFFNCPRCGLSIRRRVEWHALEHCPRCAGRAGIAVQLFVSARPAVSWHRDGPAPDDEQPRRTRRSQLAPRNP